MEYVLQRRGNECVDCISLNNPEKSLTDVFPILTWIQKLFWEKVTCSSFRWDNITSILVSTWYKCENKECLIIIQQVYHMHQIFVTYIRGQNIFRRFDILPQVKRSAIISNKNCIYELHDELPNGNLWS